MEFKKKDLNGLTRENYFSKENSIKYMGASQFKSFKKCEYDAIAQINEEYEKKDKKALIQGQLMDALFEGGFETFCNLHPELISTRGSSKGELKSEYQFALQAFEFVQKDKFFMEQCTGEQQKIFTGEIAGVPFKIMIDSLHDDVIVDRKFMRDIESKYDSSQGCRVPFWSFWGYDIQAAIYQEIYYQNTGKRLPFRLAVITKEDVPNKVIIEFDQYILDNALDEVKELAPRFNAIKLKILEPTKCGECDWCKYNKLIQQTDILKASSFLDNGGVEFEEEQEEEYER